MTTGYPIFRGSNITLGGVKITGRRITDFSLGEVTKFVALFLDHNCDENGVFEGTLYRIIERMFGQIDAEEYPESNLRKITRLLKALGYRYNFLDKPYWYTPNKEKSYVGSTKLDIPKREEPPVTRGYICIDCKKRFDEGEEDEFIKHRGEEFSRKEKEMKTKAKSYICKVCRAEFDDGRKLGGHMVKHRAEQKRKEREIAEMKKMVHCKYCGKEIRSDGLGGHMQSHRLSKSAASLLDAIRLEPGLHPREYAEMLNASDTTKGRTPTAASVSSAGMRLKKMGHVKTTGGRASVRYWPVEFEIPDMEKPLAKKAEKSFVPPKKTIKATESAKQDIPAFAQNWSGFATEQAMVIRAKNGKVFVLTESGDMYEIPDNVSV